VLKQGAAASGNRSPVTAYNTPNILAEMQSRRELLLNRPFRVAEMGCRQGTAGWLELGSLFAMTLPSVDADQVQWAATVAMFV